MLFNYHIIKTHITIAISGFYNGDCTNLTVTKQALVMGAKIIYPKFANRVSKRSQLLLNKALSVE